MEVKLLLFPIEEPVLYEIIYIVNPMDRLMNSVVLNGLFGRLFGLDMKKQFLQEMVFAPTNFN